MNNKIPFLTMLFFCLCSCHLKEEPGVPLNSKSPLQDSLFILKNTIAILQTKNDSLQKELGYWLSDEDIMKLKQKKMADPLVEITNRLENSPNVIPYHGVLGGTMRFGKITLLRDRWAIAEFDDGHIMGSMLLKYTFQRDTIFQWTVLDKFLE